MNRFFHEAIGLPWKRLDAKHRLIGTVPHLIAKDFCHHSVAF